MSALIHDDSKPYTDRDRYTDKRNQLLHNYERAVENAQYLYGEIDANERKQKEIVERLTSLQASHKEALARIKEEETKLTEFIKTRRHFQDA